MWRCSCYLSIVYLYPVSYFICCTKKAAYQSQESKVVVTFLAPLTFTIPIPFLREADDDFLDELLGGVGGQIASLIPRDVDSQVFCSLIKVLQFILRICYWSRNILQNISDIAELGLDNPEIYENLLNALEEMGGGDEDSEVRFRLSAICCSLINFAG